jgi:hypothetical protein
MDQAPPTVRDSFVRLQPDVVMLVRVEAWEEQMLLLRDLGAQVVRVRHPLPACERMRVVKPAVIIVGAGVRTKDFELMVDEAYELRAAVLQMGQVPFGRLRTWIATALDRVRARRKAEAEAAQESGAQEEAPQRLAAG